MSANSSDEIPDAPPPALPDTPPPDTLPFSSTSTLRRSPSPFSGPEKPPRIFSDAHSPNSSKTSRDSSPTPSGSFQTPPDSLQMIDVNQTPSSDALENTSSSSSQMPLGVPSIVLSSNLSPPAETSKKRSSTLSHPCPSDAPENHSSDSVQPPSDAPRGSSSSDVPKTTLQDVTKKTLEDVPKTALEDVTKKTLEDVPKTALEDVTKKTLEDVPKTALEDVTKKTLEDVPKTALEDVTKKTPEDVPTVTVEPAEGDAAAADDVFLESGDQSTAVLLRKPSQRRKGSSGALGDSRIKRVVSARIDRIGSALSRLLDRDKGAPGGDQGRPKSMGAFEASIIRNDRENGSAENRESIVPYGSTFLRRSFRQKSAESEGEARPPPSPGCSTAARQSVYNEDLVASLVCAACAHYMVAPIEQCKRGHNICKFCRRLAHQHRCPVCNARLSGIRNVVAEDMARKLLFPCVHAHAGCTRQVPNDELEFHEPRCPFRVYRCLINVASGVPCKWEGRRGELEQHVAAVHPRYYSPQETTKWRWSPNLLVKMEDFQLISAFGELFWYCAAQDPERLRVCWFVQHIGYDHDSVKYEFRFAFVDEEKDRRLELACTTLPDYSSVGSIVESGRCLDMSYQQALSFVDEEGTIKFAVTICKLD